MLLMILYIRFQFQENFCIITIPRLDINRQNHFSSNLVDIPEKWDASSLHHNCIYIRKGQIHRLLRPSLRHPYSK